MDPTIQAFLDRLDSTLAAHTAAIQASTARIDEIVAWRPDLERRIADLGDAVAALQHAQPPPPSSSGEDGKAGAPSNLQPATHGFPPGVVAGARQASLTGLRTAAMIIYHGGRRRRCSRRRRRLR